MARHGSASIEYIVLKYVQRLIGAGERRSSGHCGRTELQEGALNACLGARCVSERYKSVSRSLVKPDPGG